jgi:hypothetical protein
MWELKDPRPAKLIIGVLGADDGYLSAAEPAMETELGGIDLVSEVWPFDQTDYYRGQTGKTS